MVNPSVDAGKRDRFASPPWTVESLEWQALDQRLPADHLVRRIDQAVAKLDLTPLWESYLGVGKKALPPDLLLKLVLYEMHSKRPSPAQWSADVRDSEAVRWLLFGLQPSRSRLYDFRDRVAPFWDGWNTQVLRRAIDREMTTAARASLDSSSIAANASRRRLLNDERLEQRQQIIDAHLEASSRGQLTTEKPGWLAGSETGLREQKRRYALAAAVLRQRQALNAQRPSSKRKPADKILVSPADPEAALARDKEEVFRPLYVVQILRDLDSPLIFAHAVRTQNNDSGALAPMIKRMADNVGVKPKDLLVDSGYVSMQHLEFCQTAGITLYGPCQENDFSAANDKKAQHNQHTELPKSAFTWLAEERTYQCPEGHRFEFQRTTEQWRVEGPITLSLYRCPPPHCQTCPRQPGCTRTPKSGRTVSRMENEELLDALRERMRTVAGKTLYRQRARTVELNFADLKEHRGLRRFHGRGLRRVTAEVSALMLTHNVLAVEEHARQRRQTTDALAPLTQAA